MNTIDPMQTIDYAAYAKFDRRYEELPDNGSKRYCIVDLDLKYSFGEDYMSFCDSNEVMQERIEQGDFDHEKFVIYQAISQFNA